MTDTQAGDRKIVFNANVGIDNVVQGEDIDKTMIQAFDRIASILSDHCGPFSKYAMIPNANNPLAEPAFTKDGLSILAALEFASPIENYIKEQVLYISKHVERISGDGTTSSAIIVTETLKHLKASLNNAKKTFGSVKHFYSNFNESIVKSLEDKVIKPQDDWDKDQLYRFVYNQAYTSSHGDSTLAHLVAKVYSGVPKSLWRSALFKRERYETEDLYRLEEDNSAYSCKKVMMPSNNMYNDPTGTKYIGKGVDVIITAKDLITNCPNYKVIRETIDSYIEEDKPVVLIAPPTVDSSLIADIEVLMNTSPNAKIAIFFLRVENPRANDLIGLNLTLGGNYSKLGSSFNIIKDVDVTFEDECLTINNIYDNLDTLEVGGDFHPYLDERYDCIEAHNFRNYIADLEVFVNNINAIDKPSPGDLMSKELFQTLIEKMTLKKRSTLIIGGSGYDHRAAYDVVEDVMKATSKSLIEGYVLGGNTTLLECINDRLENSLTGPSINTSMFYNAFKSGIVYTKKQTLSRSDVIGRRNYLEDLETSNKIVDVLSGLSYTLDDVRDYVLNGSGQPCNFIVQPISTDIELLKRFGEVALKFLFMDKVVVPGAVVLNQQEE